MTCRRIAPHVRWQSNALLPQQTSHASLKRRECGKDARSLLVPLARGGALCRRRIGSSLAFTPDYCLGVADIRPRLGVRGRTVVVGGVSFGCDVLFCC